jgi:hypothetical protein
MLSSRQKQITMGGTDAGGSKRHPLNHALGLQIKSQHLGLGKDDQGLGLME